MDIHAGANPAERFPAPRVEEPPLDYELLFRKAPSLLLVLAPVPAFTILEASDAFLRSKRTSRAAIVGRGFFEAFPETPEGGRNAGGNQRASLERVLAAQHAHGLNSPVFSAEGEIRYIIHRVEAIEIEVLRSSRERDEAVRRFEGAKEEFEAFAYSASHDLRAPLRAIAGFCGLLRDLHAENLPSQARDFIERIDSSAKGMATILEALVLLSRVDKLPLERGRVDVAALARRVAAELRLREPTRPVTLVIAEGLEASADQNLLAIVLASLLGNAWKYTAPREDARVEVGRRIVAGLDVFYVKDNGVGFDMAHAGKLFTSFFRLHGACEFEGTGLGLATARRVIERHGGEIWAQAKPGEGATISFTLEGGANP